MMDHQMSVRRLDKSYQVKCPVDMAQELQDAAVYLDQHMREIRDSGKVIGVDRIAIMTALNVTHELLTTGRKENKWVGVMAERIRDMQKKIEEALTITEQEEL